MFSIFITLFKVSFFAYAVKLASTQTSANIKGMFACKWVDTSNQRFIIKWVKRAFWSALAATALMINVVFDGASRIRATVVGFAQSANSAAQNG